MEGTEQFKERIKSYLDERAKNDELFAEFYANENKSIDNCINFIFKSVKQLNKHAFADEEIYSMAVHYYNEENLQNVEFTDRVEVKYSGSDIIPSAPVKKQKAVKKVQQPDSDLIQGILF